MVRENVKIAAKCGYCCMHSSQPIFLKQFDLKSLHLQKYGSGIFSPGLYVASQARWAPHPSSTSAKSLCISFVVFSVQTASMIHTSLVLHIIAAVWKQSAAAGSCVWMRFSPAKFTVLEEEGIIKKHHTNLPSSLT